MRNKWNHLSVRKVSRTSRQECRNLLGRSLSLNWQEKYRSENQHSERKRVKEVVRELKWTADCRGKEQKEQKEECRTAFGFEKQKMNSRNRNGKINELQLFSQFQNSCFREFNENENDRKTKAILPKTSSRIELCENVCAIICSDQPSHSTFCFEWKWLRSLLRTTEIAVTIWSAESDVVEFQ